MQIDAWGNYRILTPGAQYVADYLDKWDPLGVYSCEGIDQAPAGEYRDLVVPILAALSEGATVESLATDLVQVMTDDYGIVMDLAETTPVAQHLFEWYRWALTQ